MFPEYWCLLVIVLVRVIWLLRNRLKWDNYYDVENVEQIYVLYFASTKQTDKSIPTTHLVRIFLLNLLLINNLEARMKKLYPNSYELTLFGNFIWRFHLHIRIRFWNKLRKQTAHINCITGSVAAKILFRTDFCTKTVKCH